MAIQHSELTRANLLSLADVQICVRILLSVDIRSIAKGNTLSMHVLMSAYSARYTNPLTVPYTIYASLNCAFLKMVFASDEVCHVLRELRSTHLLSSKSLKWLCTACRPYQRHSKAC